MSKRIPVEETFPWQRPVLSVLSAPPAESTKGDRHIVGADATGDWTGHENDIAWHDGSAWQFDTPAQGWRLHDIDTDTDYLYVDSAWVEQPMPSDITELQNAISAKITGVNTGKITVSATEPSNPTIGDLWVDISS